VLVATPHRRLSAAAAVDLAIREAERMGMRLRSHEIGPASCRTTASALMDRGTTMAVGHGKGAGLQAVSSAHFEALERYFTSVRSNRRYSDAVARLLPATVIAGQRQLRADLVIQRWAAEFPEAVAACTPYHGGRTTIWYPLFLIDPRYHLRPLPGDGLAGYRSLLRYTSSLGTAAGADPAEAVLHSLCELIEHDGVSHALLRWFVAGEPELDLVPREELPGRLRDLWHDAEHAYGATVYLIDVTTDLGVPVYLAVAHGDGTATSAAGAGASPVAGYAAERALAELIQATATPRASAAAVTRDLGAWPPLRDCALLPVPRLLSGVVRRVALRDGTDDAATVPAAVDRLARVLDDRGIGFFSYLLSPADSLVSVAAVVAPGLERFSLVRLGVPVAPTGRGHQVWTAAPRRRRPARRER
jgi:ribosomal protein S12 methylthiotransferase accessory factor YcaO